MAPEVAEVVWYSEDSASPLTVAKPGSFASGDILIATIWQHNNPSNQSELTTSADWVLEGNCDGTISDAKVFSHVYDPSDPATWSFNYRATADVCLCLLRITGADQAPVVTVTSTATASTTSSMDSPSLNPGGSDDLFITILGAHGNGSAMSVSDPAGMTDLSQVQVASQYMAMAAAHEALVSSAPTGVRTWTSLSPTGQTGGTISIAVKSPATSDPLDPIVNVAPPRWIALRIAMEQTQNRFQQSAPPPPGAENGTLVGGITASGSAVKVAACSGRAGLGLSVAGTETRSDVYIAEYFSSVQSDGLGNGSAITTARTYTGDYLIVAVTDSQSTTPPTKPGGWSDITLPDNSSGTNFEVFLYYLLNPAAQTTYTWTVTGGRRTIIGALVRGASTSSLLDEADSLETVTGTTHASPSVLTLGTNRAILAFNVLRGFPTSTWSQASGWLEYVQRVGGDATTNMQVSLQARTAPTQTTYSDTFGCSVSEPAIVVLLAVIPAVGGTGATAENGSVNAALRTASAATKIAVQNGTCSVPVRSSGTDTKKAIAASSTTIALTTAGNESKKSINVGTSLLVVTAAETASPRQQTGKVTIPLRQTGAETKIAIAAGTDQLPLRSSSVAVKISKSVGTTTTALTDSSLPAKKSIDVATLTTSFITSGMATTGTARVQSGTCAVTLRATSAATKISSDSGTSVLPLRNSSTAVKIAKTVGTTALPLRDASIAQKKSINVGTAALAMAAVGAVTSAVARAQSGSCTVPLRNAGSAVKKSTNVANTSVALRCASNAQKIAKPVAVTALALHTFSTQQKKALLNGRLSVSFTVTFTVQVVMANPNTIIRFGPNITIIQNDLGNTIISNVPGQTLIERDTGQTIIAQPQGQTLISL